MRYETYSLLPFDVGYEVAGFTDYTTGNRVLVPFLVQAGTIFKLVPYGHTAHTAVLLVGITVMFTSHN
jgi:hypothetical protein